MSILLSVTPLTSNSLSLVSLLYHIMVNYFLIRWWHLVLARESRLSRWAAATRAWWTEIHCYSMRLFIAHLVAAALVASWLPLMLMLMSSIKVLPAPDTCTFFDICLISHNLLQAAAGKVLAVAVAIDLCLAGWASISHWRVAVTRNMASDW